MSLRMLRHLALIGLAGLVFASIMTAVASANTVTPTGLGESHRAITPNDLKPPECADQNITNLIVGTGAISGTAENDLILGGPGPDTISGAGGDDCILSGGGADTIDGGPGTDTCIGGGGSDTLDDSCESRRP